MEILIATVGGLTSITAYVIALRWCGLSRDGLWAALGKMLECVGMALIFAVANLALAAGFILAVRVFLGGFLTLYLLDDSTWLVLPALQGVTWGVWRQAGATLSQPSASSVPTVPRAPTLPR
jgi:hypothetical protein